MVSLRYLLPERSFADGLDAVILAPFFEILINERAGELIVGRFTGLAFGAALKIEAERGAVVYLIFCFSEGIVLTFGEAAAVGDGAVKGGDTEVDYCAALSEHLVADKGVLFFGWNDVKARNDKHAVVDPFSAVAGKGGELVHRKPQKALIYE